MNLIQNVLSFFYEARTNDFVIYSFKPSQVPDDLQSVALPANQCYLRIDLRSLRIVNVQRGLTRFFGMVSSHITVPHLGSGEAEFQTVIAPPELKDVKAGDLDRFLSFNHPLAGPVPFRGGDVGLQVGLFSVESANLLDPFIGLLEDIAKLSSVEFINVAQPYAGLLTKGVSLLTGVSSQKSLEIGISTVADQIESGWRLIMRANRSDFPEDRLAKLRVTRDDSKLMEGNQPVTDYPYMILRVSGAKTRDDWFKIPELRFQHDLFTQALRKGDANDVQPALIAFQRFAHTCPDLLKADADRIAAIAKQDAERLYPPTGTAEEAYGVLEPMRLKDYAIYGDG